MERSAYLEIRQITALLEWCLHLLSVTASFGVADYNEQMKSLEDLIKLADVALYKAKNSGRNIVCEIEEIPEVKNTQAIL